MSGAVEIRPGTAQDDEARDVFVRAQERGTFFHLSGWRRVVERVFGHRPADLLAWRGDELVGVLPLMRCTSPLGKAKLISMPYAVYGGPVGVDADVERALIASACRLADEQRVGRLELRTIEAPPDCPLVRSELYATFRAELPEKAEDVLPSMPKKARAEARKARTKHGLELVEGGWYLDDLHRLFHRNKRDLGSPGLPRTLFEGLAREFGDEVRLHLVHRDREPLMAVMSFCFRDHLLAYYAGTADGADRAYSASNFMYMALREWACEQGFRVFDFGRSRKDAGAFAFKKRQGFEPTDLDYRYHLVRDRELPSFTPSNPKTKVLRETWSKLPAWLTERLSGSLARYLP